VYHKLLRTFLVAFFAPSSQGPSHDFSSQTCHGLVWLDLCITTNTTVSQAHCWQDRVSLGLVKIWSWSPWQQRFVTPTWNRDHRPKLWCARHIITWASWPHHIITWPCLARLALGHTSHSDWSNQSTGTLEIQLDWTRNQCTTVAQLRTGHCPLLASYLHRIGRQQSPACPHCGGDDETAQHLLLCCSSHAQTRSSTNYINSTDPRRMWSFLESIGAVTRPLPDWEWERGGRERERRRERVMMCVLLDYFFNRDCVSKKRNMCRVAVLALIIYRDI